MAFVRFCSGLRAAGARAPATRTLDVCRRGPSEPVSLCVPLRSRLRSRCSSSSVIRGAVAAPRRRVPRRSARPVRRACPVGGPQRCACGRAGVRSRQALLGQACVSRVSSCVSPVREQCSVLTVSLAVVSARCCVWRGGSCTSCPEGPLPVVPLLWPLLSDPGDRRPAPVGEGCTASVCTSQPPPRVLLGKTWNTPKSKGLGSKCRHTPRLDAPSAFAAAFHPGPTRLSTPPRRQPSCSSCRPRRSFRAAWPHTEFGFYFAK